MDITSIKLTGASGFASTITADGTYATSSGNVTVSGLTGTGNTVTITGLDNITTVDITTSSPMDRLAVKGVDANEGCDITEFHYSATSTNAHTEEVGSFINFDDSGPALSITAAPVVGAAAVVEASGAGGQSQATITAPTFTASAVDGFTTDVSLRAGPGGRDSDRAADDGGQPCDHAGGRLGHPDLGQVRQRRQRLARCDGVHGDAVRHDGDADVVGCP